MSKIIVLRNQKVILDRDLAEMYGVETKMLKRAVKRNLSRFPEDFMFELSDEEIENLRYQFGTSSWWWSRYIPMAFTEHGILMLSSVLRSDKAVETNIQIIRVFNSMRRMLATNEALYKKIQGIEVTLWEHNQQIQALRFERRKMIEIDEEEEKRSIGFKIK